MTGQANGRANGPEFTSRFLAFLNRCAALAQIEAKRNTIRTNGQEIGRGPVEGGGEEGEEGGMGRERCGWVEEGESRPSAGGIERYRTIGRKQKVK